MPRKQNGQVFARGNQWLLRYWDTRRELGQLVRKRVTHTLGPVTGKTAKMPEQIARAAAAHMAKVNASRVDPEKVVTLIDFIEHVYLPLIEREKRPSTTCAYRLTWARLKPHCQNVWLRDARTVDVQRILDRIVETAGHPLSVSTLQHAKFFLSGAFNEATRSAYRDGDNPVRGSRIPKQAKRHGGTRAYTDEEVSRLLRTFGGDAGVAIAVAAHTGMRCGEIEGLEWADLQETPEGPCLLVRRSIWNGHASDPKTAESAAPVPVTPELAQFLDLQHARQGHPKAGPLFRTVLGTRRSMSSILNREILPLCNRCKVCGLPKGVQHVPQAKHEWERDPAVPRWYGWHAFRRAVATGVQRDGGAAATAQGCLRHSQVQTTLAHYTKTVRVDVRQALEKRAKSISPEFQDTNADFPPVLGALPKIVN